MPCCGTEEERELTFDTKKLLHGYMKLQILAGSDLYDPNTFGVADPVIHVEAGPRRIAATKTINDNTTDPTWNETLHLYLCDETDELVLKIKDSDPTGYGDMGAVVIKTEDILNKKFRDPGPQDLELRGTLTYGYHFFAACELDQINIPGIYFEPTQSNMVTPFQCAVCHPGLVPDIQTDLGVFEPESYFFDLYSKIKAAKTLIYITGWSVWTKLQLCRNRGPREEKEETLGELLIQKADQGVRVCVMVWNDLTSRPGCGKMLMSLLGLASGLMETHDEETFAYFRNSKVHCANVPRPGGDMDFKSAIFTHHQKSVMLDHEGKLIAYVGGIDLCDGRWDTPEHPLFRTLDHEHKNDYHQCMMAGSTVDTGPREGWQDLHARLEGRVARDVVQNFEERWRKLAPGSLGGGANDMLLTKEEMNALGSDSCTSNGRWNVQFLRSIDTLCAELEPERPLENSLTGAGLYDRSIQLAYINHIRRAKRFIYVENQYFMGSSHWWTLQDPGSIPTMCTQLIPVELAQKVASKIRARQPFHVYVVIPMWPEGIPIASAVQEGLHWQYKTVDAMYRIIAKAIKETGQNRKPRDYLTFYCLANRQIPDEKRKKKSLIAHSMMKHNRAPVYVHSKFMDVDDETIIMGSANINQRSMDGARDTEMAYSAYQPEFLTDGDTCPRGHVQAFRMQIFSAHLGIKNQEGLEVFRDPHTPEAVNKFRQIADGNWDRYLQDSSVDAVMDGHVVPYPYSIADDGEVKAFRGKVKVVNGVFPDTVAAKIIGGRTRVPDIMTT